MIGDNQGWFWTPQRLATLGLILGSLSQRDKKGLYIGPIGLSRAVSRCAARGGFVVNGAQVSVGLRIMVFLGVLEPGKPGTKLPGYKRRYYPEKLKGATEAGLMEFRRSLGIKSPLPPPR